jgi:TctA family transporter
MSQSSQDPRDESRWPLSQMLLRGTFGTGSRAEHRLATRSTVIFVVLFGWLMISRLTHVESGVRSRAITVLLTALALTYYAWEKRKYFLSLDELPRRIELEGIAWADVVGVIAALWAGSIGYVVSVVSTGGDCHSFLPWFSRWQKAPIDILRPDDTDEKPITRPAG